MGEFLAVMLTVQLHPIVAIMVLAPMIFATMYAVAALLSRGAKS